LGTAGMTGVNVWGLIDDSQTASWSAVSDSQTPSWENIVT